MRSCSSSTHTPRHLRRHVLRKPVATEPPQRLRLSSDGPKPESPTPRPQSPRSGAAGIRQPRILAPASLVAPARLHHRLWRAGGLFPRPGDRPRVVFQRQHGAVAGRGQRRMVGTRTVAHRRPLGRSRCGGGGAGAVGTVVRGCQFARVAAIGRLRAAGDVARHTDRRRPQDRHQRGLSLGSRRLRRPESLCRAVRGPSRVAVARAVFSRRACVVGIRADVFLLRISRSLAPRWRAGCWRRAIAVGIAFSIGQEARGAHFLSHDLTSAAIVWFVQLGLYAWYRRQAD